MLAFRIIESKDRDKTVHLKLSRDGLEDPRAASVILDEADLPGYPYFDNIGISIPFRKEKRPRVLVNGVEMFLQLYKEQPVYEVAVNRQVSGWVIYGSEKGKPLQTLTQTGRELIMVVAWE